MFVNIISECNRRIPRKKVKELFSLIDGDEEPPDSTVNVVFIRDARMKKLNREYRNINKSTDVLSFNIDNEPGENSVLGEIYISMDMAAKYAKSDNITITDEILRLCCHGLLHLLEYDHLKASEAAIMKDKENYYLGRLKR